MTKRTSQSLYLERALRNAAARGTAVTADVALRILKAAAGELPAVFAAASAMRRRFRGNEIHLCSIVNARSGACSEDCVFCAQSVHHHTRCGVFGMRSPAVLVDAYRQACTYPISRFGVVTSGPGPGARAIERLIEAVKATPKGSATWCASLGSVDAADLKRLRAAGIPRYHHNLETAESFFPKVCTTHSYSERLETLRRAREAGLQVCSGGILGMGESPRQRVEFALTLARERVDSIPLNFLVPIPGTPLEHCRPLEPMDILRTISMFRMTNPRAEIKVCAGRVHLRGLQSMIFLAGATGMMMGPLLTVSGCDPEQDVQTLRDLELLT